MAYTKRTFIAVALRIKMFREYVQARADSGEVMDPSEVDVLVNDFSDLFEVENPRFDKEKFIKACQ